MNFQLRRHILKELFSQGHLRMKTLLLASMEPAAFFVELGNDVRRPMTKAGEGPLVLEQLDKLHRRPRTVAELLASKRPLFTKRPCSKLSSMTTRWRCHCWSVWGLECRQQSLRSLSPALQSSSIGDWFLSKSLPARKYVKLLT